MNKSILKRITRINSYHIYIIIFYFSDFHDVIYNIIWNVLRWVDYKNTGTISVGEIIVKNDLFFDGSGKLVTYLAVFSVLSWFCITKIGSKG